MHRRVLLFFAASVWFLGGVGISQAEDEATVILDKAIKAHGGEAKLAAIKAEKIKSKGSNSQLSIKINGKEAEDVNFTRETSCLFPDKIKEDTSMELPMFGEFHIVTVFNKGKGSVRFSGLAEGSKDLEGDGLTELKEKMHRKWVSQLVCLKEKDYTLSPLGEVKVAGKPVVGIKVKAKGFRDIDLFFDKKTGLLAKTVYRPVDAKGGKEVTEEEIVTDYQKVDGISVPKKIVVKRGSDQVGEEEFVEVKLLKTLDEKEFATPQDNKLKGEVKSINFDSKHLSGTREVKVYLPPGHDPKKRYPVIYAADGFSAVKCENIESLITSGKVPPLIIVGTAANNTGDPFRDMMRQKEYCPGWFGGKAAFEAHEKFFIEEVLPWAERKWGASRERKQRIVYGSSNGAPFALTMANRHPKLFGHVFAYMVYGLNFAIFKKELKAQLENPTRYILVVGSEDADGIKENQEVEKLLKEKKFPVDSVIIDGMGHSPQLEHQELPGCVEAALENKKYLPRGQTVEKTAAPR